MEKKKQRIVFAGGGTGGHLFPALAVAGELARRRPDSRIEFVGARRGLERRLVPQAGYELLALRLGGLKGASGAGKLRAVVAAAWAVLRCLLWLSWPRPVLVVGVGGYASGPAVLAAKLLRLRTMVLEQNHYPGATNRWLAPRVDAVCVPSAIAATALRGRTIVTGNPVRREFVGIGEPPSDGEPVLLIFGGSRGARSINQAAADALTHWAAEGRRWHVMHQTGSADESRIRQCYADRWDETRYEVQAFFDDMPKRLEQAHLVVCRAGATTLAELCAAGRPAVLVPYPHASDDHQQRNAEALESAGAAVTIRDVELDGPTLARSVGVVVDDPERRAAMGRAALELAQPDAAERIADIAEELIDVS